jgi:hypothetical protein
MLALSEPLCYAAIAVVLDRKYRRNSRKSSDATWCWQRYKYKRTELRPWGHNIHHSPTWTAQLNLLPFRKLHSPEILTAQTYGNFQHTLDLTAQLLAVQLKLKVKLYMCGAPNILPCCISVETRIMSNYECPNNKHNSDVPMPQQVLQSRCYLNILYAIRVRWRRNVTRYWTVVMKLIIVKRLETSQRNVYLKNGTAKF